MSLFVPIEWALIGAVIVIAVIEFKSLLLIPQYGTQLWLGLTGQDHICDVSKTTMKLRGGKKENPLSSSVYKWKDIKGHEDVKFDPISYDDKKPATRWGPARWLFFAPLRLLSKDAVSMLGQKECLEVARTFKAKPEDAKAQDASGFIAGLKKAVREHTKHFHRPKYDDAELGDIIEYNEYLCKIAQGNPRIALNIMKAYGHSDHKELNRLCHKHIMLPANVDISDKTKVEECVKQLKYEVMMVCEYMNEVAMRPDFIPFAEMMMDCPDDTTTSDIYGKVEQETKNDEGKVDVSKYVKYVLYGTLGGCIGSSILWLIAWKLMTN